MNYRMRNASSFLSGAGLGAILMYLFDPEEGMGRRKNLRRAASSAAEGTRETLGATWDALREKAGDYSHAASAGVSALGKTLGEQAGNIGKSLSKSDAGEISQRASTAASQAAHSASGLGEELIERLRSALGRQSSRFGRRSAIFVRRRFVASRSILPETFLAIGCIGLGVGAMYLFDPIAGRRRRHRIRDKFFSGLNRASTRAQRAGQDVWNRTRGFAHEARGRLSLGEEVDDATLAERVRSQLGRCVSNPHAVRVSARDGRIILTGPVSTVEVDDLLKCVWSIRGVRELVNQLELSQPGLPGRPASAVSDLPGEQPGI